MQALDEALKKMETFFDSFSFFTVPDGKQTGYFLIDANGNSIDCNIYHPKYGRRYEASFFNGTHYTDERTGKKISCRYFREILCVHQNSSYTNKDGEAVFKKKSSFTKTKTAETEKDFKVIYQREKNKTEIKDESFFINYLLEQVSEKEKEYKEKINYKERDPKTLENFNSFTNWLIKLKQSMETRNHGKECGQMTKCNHYPNCDCYTDWEKAADEIDHENADLFVVLMREMDHFLVSENWIRYKPVFNKVKAKLEVLPEFLHGLFIAKLLAYIEFNFLWKMPEKSDLLRLKKSLVNIFFSDHDMAFYENEMHIPNQELMKETIQYFKTGEGSRVYKPMQILNLWDKQYHFIKDNIEQTEKVIGSLKALPFSELEKHVLLALIIKWFGGYPINNLDENYNRTLKGIEKDFLSYPADTPEKEFCKADKSRRNQFMRLEIALTTALNYNVDPKQILDAMEESSSKTTYPSFDALFEKAARNNMFGHFANQQAYLIERSRYNYLFNIWLQNSKSLEYGNEQQYSQFLNKETFLEFLSSQRENEHHALQEKQNEADSWNITNTTRELTSNAKTINKKPIFSDSAISPFFEILKDFFTSDQHSLLKNLLQTGAGTGHHLLFLSNGNRLADSFKKLYEHYLITGCQKQDLERWILSNFKYQPKNQIKSFTSDYIEKCISRNSWPCKDPIINIVNGQIQKTPPIRKKKQ